MKTDTFTFRFPDETEIIAQFCSVDFMLQKRTEHCPSKRRGKHNFKPLMDISQWGFTGFRFINVYRCEDCSETWAVRGEMEYGEEEPARKS